MKHTDIETLKKFNEIQSESGASREEFICFDGSVPCLTAAVGTHLPRELKNAQLAVDIYSVNAWGDHKKV